MTVRPLQRRRMGAVLIGLCSYGPIALFFIGIGLLVAGGLFNG